jgi:hypothetical protein
MATIAWRAHAGLIAAAEAAAARNGKKNQATDTAPIKNAGGMGKFSWKFSSDCSGARSSQKSFRNSIKKCEIRPKMSTM